MDNRKNHEATTSFGEVMRNAGVPTQQQYNKRMPEDTRLMILCQGMNPPLRLQWFHPCFKKVIGGHEIPMAQNTGGGKGDFLSAGRMASSGA